MAKRIFDDIKQGLEEAIAIANNTADPATYKVHVPSDIDVRAIRRKLGMTQERFASTFGFPLRTLHDWEQGRARPDTSARAYLMVIERDPQAVERALQAA